MMTILLLSIRGEGIRGKYLVALNLTDNNIIIRGPTTVGELKRGERE